MRCVSGASLDRSIKVICRVLSHYRNTSASEGTEDYSNSCLLELFPFLEKCAISLDFTGHVTKTLSFTISDLPIVILELSLTIPDQYKVCGADLGSRSTSTDLTQLCTDRRCCEG